MINTLVNEITKTGASILHLFLLFIEILNLMIWHSIYLELQVIINYKSLDAYSIFL